MSCYLLDSFSSLNKENENRSDISFWEDMWIGENSLSIMHPRLLQISDQIGRKVSDMGVWNGPIWEWTLKWRRD